MWDEISAVDREDLFRLYDSAYRRRAHLSLFEEQSVGAAAALRRWALTRGVSLYEARRSSPEIGEWWICSAGNELGAKIVVHLPTTRLAAAVEFTL